jgi:hypothetical protein
MNTALNLFLILFISLSFLAAFYLLFKAIAKKQPLFSFLSLSYLIPMGVLMTLSLKGIRLGTWEHYTFVLPFGFLGIYCAMVDLKTSPLLRQGLFALFGLLGLMNYFNSFKSDSFLYYIREKTKVAKTLPGVTNLIFTPKHPYLREISYYYSNSYQKSETNVLDAPLDQAELGKFQYLKKNYNGVNIITIENSYEDSAFKTAQDILGTEFMPRKMEYHKFETSPHPYLPKREERLKILYYVRGYK